MFCQFSRWIIWRSPPMNDSGKAADSRSRDVLVGVEHTLAPPEKIGECWKIVGIVDGVHQIQPFTASKQSNSFVASLQNQSRSFYALRHGDHHRLAVKVRGKICRDPG